jgi:hypothetical protein
VRRAFSTTPPDQFAADERLAAFLAGPPVQWSGIIRHWSHGLAHDFHPDRGGSVEIMKALNIAHDRLRELVRV